MNDKTDCDYLKDEIMRLGTLNSAARDEISRLRDKCASLNIFLEDLEEECESLRKDALIYRRLREGSVRDFGHTPEYFDAEMCRALNEIDTAVQENK
jgi:hypothetical protein